MHLPSLKILKSFQVAATRLSFKAAAEELLLTPSAISRHIKALEEQLGIALFERRTHSLNLTEAGHSYLRHVDTMFARLEAVTEHLPISHGRGCAKHSTPNRTLAKATT